MRCIVRPTFPVAAILLLAFGAGRAGAGVPPPVGSKTVQNNSPVTITVELDARDESKRCCVNLPGVVAVIPPHMSQLVVYGDSNDPNLNEMTLEYSDGKTSFTAQSYVLTNKNTSRLNELLNFNSTLTVNFNRNTFAFTLAGHN